MTKPDGIDAGLDSTRIGYNNATFEPVGAATAAKQKPLIPYWQWHKASPKVIILNLLKSCRHDSAAGQRRQFQY